MPSHYTETKTKTTTRTTGTPPETTAPTALACDVERKKRKLSTRYTKMNEIYSKAYHPRRG